MLKILISLAAVLMSGFLMAQITGLLLLGLGNIVVTTSALFWATFFEAASLSLLILHRKAFSALHVLKRGFLLGAVQWLVLVLIGVFLFDGRPLMSIALMSLCLLGFIITHLQLNKPQTAT